MSRVPSSAPPAGQQPATQTRNSRGKRRRDRPPGTPAAPSPAPGRPMLAMSSRMETDTGRLSGTGVTPFHVLRKNGAVTTGGSALAGGSGGPVSTIGGSARVSVPSHGRRDPRGGAAVHRPCGQWLRTRASARRSRAEGREAQRGTVLTCPGMGRRAAVMAVTSFTVRNGLEARPDPRDERQATTRTPGCRQRRGGSVARGSSPRRSTVRGGAEGDPAVDVAARIRRSHHSDADGTPTTIAVTARRPHDEPVVASLSRTPIYDSAPSPGRVPDGAPRNRSANLRL